MCGAMSNRVLLIATGLMTSVFTLLAGEDPPKAEENAQPVDYRAEYLTLLERFRPLLWEFKDRSLPKAEEVSISDCDGEIRAAAESAEWPEAQWTVGPPSSLLRMRNSGADRRILSWSVENDRERMAGNPALRQGPPPERLFSTLYEWMKSFLGREAVERLLLVNAGPYDREKTWRFDWYQTVNGYSLVMRHEGFVRVFMHEDFGLITFIDRRLDGVDCPTEVSISPKDATDRARAIYSKAAAIPLAGGGPPPDIFPPRYLERPIICSHAPVVVRRNVGNNDLDRLVYRPSPGYAGPFCIAWEVVFDDPDLVQKSYGIEPHMERQIKVYVHTKTGEIVSSRY